jgi:hypothetical protein
MNLYKALCLVQLLWLLKAELFRNKKGAFAIPTITLRQKAFATSTQVADITVILPCSFHCHYYVGEYKPQTHFLSMTYYYRF